MANSGPHRKGPKVRRMRRLRSDATRTRRARLLTLARGFQRDLKGTNEDGES